MGRAKEGRRREGGGGHITAFQDVCVGPLMERTAPGRLITGVNVFGYLLLDRPRIATRVPADYRRPPLLLWRIPDAPFLPLFSSLILSRNALACIFKPLALAPLVSLTLRRIVEVVSPGNSSEECYGTTGF